MNFNRFSICLLFFSCIILYLPAQTVELKGKVTASGVPQKDAIVDIYEYNAPFKTIATNTDGSYQINLLTGKEYLLLVYKSGFVLKAFNIRATASYSLNVDLSTDANSPNGLFFETIESRIAPENGGIALLSSKFDLAKIKPKSHADSLTVLLTRAKTNQYLLVSNMQLKSASTATENYALAKEIEQNTKYQMGLLQTRIEQSEQKARKLELVEKQYITASKKTKDESAQLNNIVEAQHTLAERLNEKVNYYMLLQEQTLLQSKLYDLQAVNLQKQANNAKLQEEKELIYKQQLRAKANAINYKLRAVNANNLFQYHNKLYALNYQEYIELLRYQQKKEDAKTIASITEKKNAATQNLNPVHDAAIDSLTTLEEDLRIDIVQQALAEEDRFQNFEEKQSQQIINNEAVKVTTTRISIDTYEMQIDKKNNSKYLKNGKPVTKLTYDFETKRRFVDVLKTIKRVERFER